MFMDTEGERMKNRKLAIFFVFLIGSANAQSLTQCNTKLTNQDRYDDLNKTLQCLSSKIQQLEQQILIQDKTKPVSVKNAVTETSPLPPYKGDKFLVTLISCSKKGSTISCILDYKNISNTNVEIFIKASSTYLVDENGERWNYDNGTTINWRYTNILQGTNLKSKITFKATENTMGTKFSLFIMNVVQRGDDFKIPFIDIFIK